MVLAFDLANEARGELHTHVQQGYAESGVNQAAWLLN
jgi:hypothetical protein